LGFILGGIAGSPFIILMSKSGLIGILVDQIDQTQVIVRLIFTLIVGTHLTYALRQPILLL